MITREETVRRPDTMAADIAGLRRLTAANRDELLSILIGRPYLGETLVLLAESIARRIRALDEDASMRALFTAFVGIVEVLDQAHSREGESL
jgi:2-keto-3-deoxy-galactonokinase